MLNTCKICSITFKSENSRGKCYSCLPYKKQSSWTFEDCERAAKKYSSRSEFCEKDQAKYAKASRQGWLDLLIPPKHKRLHEYTKEECLHFAKKCKNRKEFDEKYISYSNAAKKHNWLDEILPSTTLQVDQKSLKTLCLEYDHLPDFGRDHPKSLKRVYSCGLVEECFSHMSKYAGGWTKTRFRDSCKKRGYGILYLIKCWDVDETFYKLGITSTSAEERYPAPRDMPYNFEIIWEIQDCPDIVWDLEVSFKRWTKQFSYLPELHFGGYSECFVLPDAHELLGIIRN